MKRGKQLSRRTFLRGSGGVAVALPFLEAMMPSFAFAQAAPTRRFITAFGGTVVGTTRYSVPAAAGALGVLPRSWAALDAVKQHIAIVSGMSIPVYNPSIGQAYIPGGSHGGQHGFTRGPILCGMGSHDAMQIPQACKTASIAGAQTSDQHAADLIAGTTKFRSLELKVQALPYNGNASSTNGQMSARKQNGVVSSLVPRVSPLEIYNLLFSNLGTGTPSPQPSNLIAKQKSVLDLVLEDANRLRASLSGEDRSRLDLHFEEIRNIERSLAVTTTPSPQPGMTCSAPANPGPDTAPNTMAFGGWANETRRGQLQADMIAHAIACDLTRVVTWMLTHDQCWLNSAYTGNSTTVPNGGGVPDVHSDSHSAPPETCADNANWHAALFARLISNLAARTDAHGTLLSNTFLSLVFSEGATAHSRTNMTHIVAGMPSRIYNGVHIAANGAHPAKIQIAGLNAIGSNMTQMGEVSGALAALMR
jgi:hypothetical protein